MSQLHHYVGPDNISELQAIHKDAYPTAIFYLSTILGLYILGLFVILVPYMNSSYGTWSWTLNDVWDELRYVSIHRVVLCRLYYLNLSFDNLIIRVLELFFDNEIG